MVDLSQFIEVFDAGTVSENKAVIFWSDNPSTDILIGTYSYHSDGSFRDDGYYFFYSAALLPGQATRIYPADINNYAGNRILIIALSDDTTVIYLRRTPTL